VRTALPALLLLLLTAACSTGEGAGGPTATPAAPVDGRLTVRASEWGFEPSSIVVERGQAVTIVLQNDGRILHDLKLDDLDAEVLESRSSGPLEADPGELFVGADSGKEGTLVFRPLEAGSYTFYCTVQGHRAFGMEGTLTVN
jgi:uncharacterized cupredoxin-like copper-binding protein